VQVELIYDRKRVLCKTCGWRAEKVPWAVNPRAIFTQEFDDQVAFWAQRTDKTSAATAFRVSWSTVGSCIQRAVNRRQRGDPLADLKRIGVDEISYRKHHRYLTVVVDLDRHKVVWAKEGKNAATLEAFFDELGEDRCRNIEIVTADMSAAYTKAVKDRLPHAQLVYDRFHVQKLVSEAVDETRREEWRRLRQEDDPKGAKAVKGSRWCLLKKPMNLRNSERLKLAELQKGNKRLYRGYLLKEQFVEIMNLRQPAEARQMLKSWLSWASRSRLPAFTKVARTIRKHFDDIAAYWCERWSNGVTEGLNNKTRLGTRRAYGFHSAEAVIAMIMLCCADIHIPPPTKVAAT